MGGVCRELKHVLDFDGGLEGDGVCGEFGVKMGVKRNRFGGYGVALCRSVQGSVLGFCEDGNE